MSGSQPRQQPSFKAHLPVQNGDAGDAPTHAVGGSLSRGRGINVGDENSRDPKRSRAIGQILQTKGVYPVEYHLSSISSCS